MITHQRTRPTAVPGLLREVMAFARGYGRGQTFAPLEDIW